MGDAIGTSGIPKPKREELSPSALFAFDEDDEDFAVDGPDDKAEEQKTTHLGKQWLKSLVNTPRSETILSPSGPKEPSSIPPRVTLISSDSKSERVSSDPIDIRNGFPVVQGLPQSEVKPTAKTCLESASLVQARFDPTIMEDYYKRPEISLDDFTIIEDVPKPPVPEPDPRWDLTIPPRRSESPPPEDEEQTPPVPMDQVTRLLMPLTETIMKEVEKLWEHRLVKAYLDRWFPKESDYRVIHEIGGIANLPKVLVPLLAHIFRKFIQKFAGGVLNGGWTNFEYMIRNTGIDEDLQQKLLAIGLKVWEGEGDPRDHNLDFTLAIHDLEKKKLRVLQQAQQDLWKTNRAAAEKDLIRQLDLIGNGIRLVAGSIEIYFDGKAHMELGSAGVLPPEPEIPEGQEFGSKYPEGTLGHATERIIFQVSKNIQDQFSRDFLEQAVHGYRESDTCEASDFLDELVTHAHEFSGVLAQLVEIGTGPCRRFLTRSLENFLRQVLAHDHSELCEALAAAAHLHSAIFWESRDAVKPFIPGAPKAVLRNMSDKAYRGWKHGKHESILVDRPPAESWDAQIKYLERQVLPKLQDLLFPGSSLLQELIQSLKEGDERWEKIFVQKGNKTVLLASAGFAAVDGAIRRILAHFLGQMIDAQLSAPALNETLIHAIEGKWKAEIEALKIESKIDLQTALKGKSEAEKQAIRSGWRARQDFIPARIRVLESERYSYERAQYNILKGVPEDGEEDFYIASRLALTYANKLWLDSGAPGVTKLFEGTILQLHEMLQCTPVAKSLIFQMMDVLLTELAQNTTNPFSNLKQDIATINARVAGDKDTVFSDSCLKEMAKLVLDLLRDGGNHLPEDTSIIGNLTLTVAGILAGLKEDWAVGWIKGQVNSLWQEKWELSFPGVLAVILEHVEEFVLKADGGMKDQIRDTTEQWIGGGQDKE